MNKNNNPIDTIRVNIWLGRTTLFSAPCIPPVVYGRQEKSFLVHSSQRKQCLYAHNACK